MTDKGLKRGQPITFRIPSDTSDYILKQLQKLKEVERRNFSSKIAEFVMLGVNDSLAKQREAITIPLPKGLTKAQRDWLKHEQSEVLLGSIVYQLLSDPTRTASIFASLNSHALGIGEDFYETAAVEELDEEWNVANAELKTSNEGTRQEVHLAKDDDLDSFNWENIKRDEDPPIEEEDMEDALADFLAQMNK